MTDTTTVRFFVSERTNALLRRRHGGDDVFVDGAWKPTETVMKYMIGEDPDVEPATEEQARVHTPDAFPVSGEGGDPGGDQ